MLSIFELVVQSILDCLADLLAAFELYYSEEHRQSKVSIISASDLGWLNGEAFIYSISNKLNDFFKPVRL